MFEIKTLHVGVHYIHGNNTVMSQIFLFQGFCFVLFILLDTALNAVQTHYIEWGGKVLHLHSVTSELEFAGRVVYFPLVVKQENFI